MIIYLQNFDIRYEFLIDLVWYDIYVKDLINDITLDWQLIMVFEILEKEFVFAQECIDCQSVRKEKNFFL